MEVVRFAEARAYDVDPPGGVQRHHGVRALRLQGADATSIPNLMVGLSYYLPGGGVDEHTADSEKVYLVLSGTLTVTAGGEAAVLGALDSCRLVPGELRRVDNLTNEVATMLVLIPS